MLDDLFFNRSNGGGDRTFFATNDGYNDAKAELVARYNAGKSIDYSDEGIKRVLTAYGALSVEELRYKRDL